MILIESKKAIKLRMYEMLLFHCFLEEFGRVTTTEKNYCFFFKTIRLKPQNRHVSTKLDLFKVDIVICSCQKYF